jgi:hypothetical protein
MPAPVAPEPPLPSGFGVMAVAAPIVAMTIAGTDMAMNLLFFFGFMMVVWFASY